MKKIRLTGTKARLICALIGVVFIGVDILLFHITDHYRYLLLHHFYRYRVWGGDFSYYKQQFLAIATITSAVITFCSFYLALGGGSDKDFIILSKEPLPDDIKSEIYSGKNVVKISPELDPLTRGYIKVTRLKSDDW